MGCFGIKQFNNIFYLHNNLRRRFPLGGVVIMKNLFYVKVLNMLLTHPSFVSLFQANAGGLNNAVRSQMPLRQRMKKVTLRDLQFLFETEKDLCKSKLLYKSYLK